MARQTVSISFNFIWVGRAPFSCIYFHRPHLNRINHQQHDHFPAAAQLNVPECEKMFFNTEEIFSSPILIFRLPFLPPGLYFFIVIRVRIRSNFCNNFHVLGMTSKSPCLFSPSWLLNNELILKRIRIYVTNVQKVQSIVSHRLKPWSMRLNKSLSNSDLTHHLLVTIYGLLLRLCTLASLGTSLGIQPTTRILVYWTEL